MTKPKRFVLKPLRHYATFKMTRQSNVVLSGSTSRQIQEQTPSLKELYQFLRESKLRVP